MIWYAPITILLAALETWRIHRVYGKVSNINHWLSYLLATVGMVILWFCIRGSYFTWPTTLVPLFVFIICCVAIRGILYDMFLNIFVNFFIAPRAVDYISTKSNSLNEDRLTKISFWKRRAFFALLLLAVVSAVHFIPVLKNAFS